MRVLIDTNVFLSHILAPTAPRTVSTVVIACFSRDEIDLLVPPEQLVELADKVDNKPYFRRHVSPALMHDVIAHLKAVGELLPPTEDVAAYSRDPKDDYLVAYGIVNEADYLITGDQDLLVLERVGELQTVSPIYFYRILRKQNLLP